MNSSISNKTDPATLLRNEIEILFTQIRLMELYVKRAQASAAHEADHLRHQHRSELALLRAELEQKEQALAARELDPTRNDFQIELHSLHARLEDIQHTLQERQSTIADLERQLQSRQRDLGDPLEQNQAEAIGQGYTDEMAALRKTIEAKDRSLHELQTVFNNLQTDSNAVINELRGQLDEQQALASQSDFKLKQAKSQITEILEQKTQLELVRKQTERLQSAQAEQMRAGVRAEIELLESQLEQREVELQTKQTLLERYNEEAQKINFEAECMRQRIAEQEATIRRFEEQTASLESERLRQSEAEPVELQLQEKLKTNPLEEDETTTRRREHDLQGATHALLSDAKETHLLLASRNEELMRVKAEMNLLQERAAEIEFSAKLVEESAASENQKMRTEYQAHVALLQAELSQKEWELAEQQARVSGMEQSFNARVQELQTQLAEKQALLENAIGPFGAVNRC